MEEKIEIGNIVHAPGDCVMNNYDFIITDESKHKLRDLGNSNVT